MKYEQLTGCEHLRGFITEQDFDQAEEEFPGIAAFYEHCLRRPGTFLDLVYQFENDLAARRNLSESGALNTVATAGAARPTVTTPAAVTV